MYALRLVGAADFSLILLILIWLRKNSPEGIKRIAGVSSHKKAMTLAVIAQVLPFSLLIYLIYSLQHILKE